MNKEYKLPEVLTELIKTRGIRKTKLAEEINVNPAAVYGWINFEYVPRVFQIMAMADYFDVSLDYLVYGED